MIFPSTSTISRDVKAFDRAKTSAFAIASLSPSTAFTVTGIINSLVSNSTFEIVVYKIFDSNVSLVILLIKVASAVIFSSPVTSSTDTIPKALDSFNNVVNSVFEILPSTLAVEGTTIISLPSIVDSNMLIEVSYNISELNKVSISDSSISIIVPIEILDDKSPIDSASPANN